MKAFSGKLTAGRYAVVVANGIRNWPFGSLY